MVGPIEELTTFSEYELLFSDPLVCMGQGISIMPGIAVRGYRHSKNYRVYPIEGNPSRRIGLLKTPDHENNPYIKVCKDLLHRFADNYSAGRTDS